jgi:hypothetical protein
LDTTLAGINRCADITRLAEANKEHREGIQLLNPPLSGACDTIHCVRKNHEFCILYASDEDLVTQDALSVRTCAAYDQPDTEM